MSSDLVIVLLMTIVVGIANAANSADDMPSKLSVTMKRETDKVAMSVEKGKTVLTIHSPFGISNAVVERTTETWPQAMVLRLHLKGLENFRVTNGSLALEAAVSSHDENERIRIWTNNKEDQRLDSKSPFWMDIRMFDSAGQRVDKVPLKAGYFEMQLPNALFEHHPRSITIHWIDFYR